jgi:hypothetical protein
MDVPNQSQPNVRLPITQGLPLRCMCADRKVPLTLILTRQRKVSFHRAAGRISRTMPCWTADDGSLAIVNAQILSCFALHVSDHWPAHSLCSPSSSFAYYPQ